MEAQRPTVFTSSNSEGVDRVIKGKGNYAFLMESTSIEYTIERNCDLTQVGGMLDSKGRFGAQSRNRHKSTRVFTSLQATELRCVKVHPTEH